MLARLGDQIELCREQIRLIQLCRASAPVHLRPEYEKLERQWRRLAATLVFAKEVSGFLEWRSRRLDPPQ